MDGLVFVSQSKAKKDSHKKRMQNFTARREKNSNGSTRSTEFFSFHFDVTSCTKLKRKNEAQNEMEKVWHAYTLKLGGDCII